MVPGVVSLAKDVELAAALAVGGGARRTRSDAFAGSMPMIIGRTIKAPISHFSIFIPLR
jgi:hypothetical protein